MTYKQRRFSELRAEDVESNLFQYHLRHIINKGLVEKYDNGYRLAPKGLYYADRYSPAHKGERLQPKLITVITIKNAKGDVLLLEKNRQPWINQWHLPAGKIHIGESAQEAASREVKEKIGICLDNLLFTAVAHVQICKDSTTVSDFVSFIFSTEYSGAVGVGKWYNVGNKDLINLAPSVQEILEIEQSKDGAFHVVKLDES